MGDRSQAPQSASDCSDAGEQSAASAPPLPSSDARCFPVTLGNHGNDLRHPQLDALSSTAHSMRSNLKMERISVMLAGSRNFKLFTKREFHPVVGDVDNPSLANIVARCDIKFLSNLSA